MLLEEIINEEKSLGRLKKLPTEAAPPQNEYRDIGQLGTLDEDARMVRSQTRFSSEQLDRMAQQAMQRREASGIADSVERRQPDTAPAFNQALVGRWLEILWKYHDIDTGAAHYIWSPVRVLRVADGLTDKRSSRARAILPGGAVLVGWDADPEFDEVAGEQWLVLLPQ